MAKVEVALRITEKIEDGLKKGVLIRIGGVVRDSKTKRIVALLKEGDLQKLGSRPGNQYLPFSVADFSMITIQQQIKALSEQIDKVYSKLAAVETIVRVINKKTDAEKFSKADALIVRARAALKNNDFEELKRIRSSVLELQFYFENFLTHLDDKSLRDILKVIPETISGHHYYFIVLSRFRLALDVLLNDKHGIYEGVQRMEATVEKIEGNLKRVSNQPQTLFFLDDHHRRIVVDISKDKETVKQMEPQFRVLEEGDELRLLTLGINEESAITPQMSGI